MHFASPTPLTRQGQTHFFIEVSDMGQFAKDWDQLKTLIRQKDDAIDRQAAQIAALQGQIASQQQFDGDDQKAVAELHEAVGDNLTPPPVAPPPAVNPPLSAGFHAPAMTAFIK